MPTSQLWHCTNPACYERPKELQIPWENSVPRCVCGSAMKKRYSPPVFEYLDFLRPEEKPGLAHAVGRETHRE